MPVVDTRDTKLVCRDTWFYNALFPLPSPSLLRRHPVFEHFFMVLGRRCCSQRSGRSWGLVCDILLAQRARKRTQLARCRHLRSQFHVLLTLPVVLSLLLPCSFCKVNHCGGLLALSL